MLSVLIQFKVIVGKDDEFKQAWAALTQHIYENFGSLGSRLHKSTRGSFVAYAQWPSLEAYESAHEWSIEGAQLRDNMSATLVSGKSTVLNKLICSRAPRTGREGLRLSRLFQLMCERFICRRLL